MILVVRCDPLRSREGSYYVLERDGANNVCVHLTCGDLGCGSSNLLNSSHEEHETGV
jgi:hypothetical protein